MLKALRAAAGHKGQSGGGGGGGSGTITVTQGSQNLGLGVDLYGYETETYGFGSRLPTTLGGVNIEQLTCLENSFGDEMIVRLTGDVAQDFFTNVTPEGGSAYTSASATYAYNAGLNHTQWKWTNATHGFTRPTLWDGVGDVTMIFV